jgi:preprotein translocase subunit SecA
MPQEDLVLQSNGPDLNALQTNAGEIEGGLSNTGVSLQKMQSDDGPVSGGAVEMPYSRKKPAVREERHIEKVGRNDPCPCGSGKKFKKCHGQEK